MKFKKKKGISCSDASNKWNVTDLFYFIGTSNQFGWSPLASRLWSCTRFLHYWSPGGVSWQVRFILFCVNTNHYYKCLGVFRCTVNLHIGESGRSVFRRLWDLITSSCMGHRMAFCIWLCLWEGISYGSAQVSWIAVVLSLSLNCFDISSCGPSQKQSMPQSQLGSSLRSRLKALWESLLPFLAHPSCLSHPILPVSKRHALTYVLNMLFHTFF